MSAISTILTRLRAAIWAIDVRDDIANAIEQCYSDVSNPTLQTEAMEAALQEKIDQGEMAALTIGDHTITAAKLAQGVIDNTLATSGAAADAKKTGDEIAAVKADLGSFKAAGGADKYFSNVKVYGSPVSIGISNIRNNYGSADAKQTGFAIFPATTDTEWTSAIKNVTNAPVSGHFKETLGDGRTYEFDYDLSSLASGTRDTVRDSAYIINRARFYDIPSEEKESVDIQQSPSDSGKSLIIGEDGRVRPGVVAGGDGLTDDIKEAILNAFDNVAWKNTSGRQYYNALYDALYGSEYPRITATLNLGERTVYTKDALETIKWYLTVTYYETAESEGTVISASNYSLVGTLSEGNNRLTVTYGNLSTTITVPAKTPKYNYRLSLGELTKHNAYPSSAGSRPFPWLDASTNRRAVSCPEGYSRFGNGNGGYTDGAYMIPVPGDATNVSVSITPASMYVAIQMWEISNSNKSHTFVSPEKGWSAGTNSGAWANPNGNLRMISCNIKANSSGSTFTTEPTEFNIAFS